ncbi:MAG: alpha/beta hydrolase [Lachnospiraceae bacterium]|nr:alpha/beta hydrolase [Lachnospiraceae bacterium]
MISEKIQLYEDKPQVVLTTYLYDPALEGIGKRKRPAVLIVSGGAYFSCSDLEGEPVALAFAAMGYHAFTLKYSVYGPEAFLNHFQGMVPKPECQHPNPMRDIAKAMMTIKDRAEEWNVDADKIAICGFSAGGHNAAMFATNWQNPVITEYFGRDKEVFRPAACILSYGISDYEYMRSFTAKSTNPFTKAFFAASNTAFFGTPEPTDEQLIEASPAKNVTDCMPPTYIWATAQDEMVPVQNSIRMAHSLADAHIPFEIHIFEEGPHGISLATQASAPAKDQIFPRAAKWVEMAESWLQKRLTIDMPKSFSFEDMDEAVKR